MNKKINIVNNFKFYPTNKLKYNSIKYKNNIAIETNKKKITYSDFYYYCKNLSILLNNLIQKPIVAILGNDNISNYISIFGTLIAGGTYVPINHNLPINYIKKIIKISNCNILIITSNNYKAFNVNDKKKLIILNKKNIFINKHKLLKKENNQSNELAYIIFTSGSTGEPKGVCISRKALDHYSRWLVKYLKITKGKKCSQHPDISFDLSVADIYGTLCGGGTLVPLTDKYQKFFPARFIRDYRITHWISVPSIIDLISNAMDFKKNNFKLLETVFFCGEPLYEYQLDLLFNVNNKLTIINAYGPTEATCSCTALKLNKINYKKFTKGTVSIGKPIPGMSIYLKDKNKKNEGQIVIKGIQVARGYLNDVKMTKNNFILNKKSSSNQYFTGDVAFIFNNKMYFKNREDRQVKIKGYRIELNEIDNALKKINFLPSYSFAISNTIVSFVSSVKKINTQSINQSLLKLIPHYMLPTIIVNLKKFPKTLNDKIDTKKLFNLANQHNNLTIQKK